MWPQIVKYIFWGLILTIILPTCTNLILKRYENRSALNQLILTQGLQPYRTKQIECNRKNFTIINNTAEELEDWKLLKILTHPYARFDENFIFKTKDEHDQFVFLIKEAFKLRRQVDQKIASLNYCHDESIYYGDNLAMLLGLSSEYHKMFDELQTKLKSTSKKQEDFSVSIFSRLNLITPNNLPDWDKVNDYIINMDHFSQKTKDQQLNKNSILDLSVSLKEKLIAYNFEYYNAWAEFYTRTNKLFIHTYQKRLS